MNQEPIESIFKSRLGQYEVLKGKAEAEVARWEWSNGAHYDLRPLWSERNRSRKGRLFKTEPKEQIWSHQYGLDNQDRLVLTRERTALDGCFYEEFLSYYDDIVEGARFGYYLPKELINVTRYYFSGSKITDHEIYGQFGQGGETYEYDENRLVAIRAWQQEHGKERIEYLMQIQYDETGGLLSIEKIFPNGYKERTYQATAKGMPSIKTITSIIKEALIDLIPKIISAANIQDTVYCVALVYDKESDSCLPPLLGLGRESERMAWRQKYGQQAKDFVWNPAEFFLFDQPHLSINDRDLLQACKLFNQKVSAEENCSAARQLLNNVAAKLMRFEWSKVLNVTPDFVVYAVDLELTDLLKNLKLLFLRVLGSGCKLTTGSNSDVLNLFQ